MDKRLSDVLAGRESNHIFPFLWMKDHQTEKLPGLVESVYNSGARAFCVESRPHEQFCRQGWWDDMDIVLAEARKRGMKVWILDDKHFPTGYANGAIKEKYPEKRKWQLVEEHVDVVGPAPESAILISASGSLEDDCSRGCTCVTEGADPEDILLGVYAYHRSEADETLDETPIDLTEHVRGRYVFWDIPAGVYRVFALYKSRRGGMKNRIHMIDPDSVRVLIDEVYEPHYAHYKAYFGNTIAGFFSDEPSFGNQQLLSGGASASMYDQKLGQPGLALPWTDEAERRMERALGRNVRGELAGLWYRRGDGHPEVRIAYMNAVTELWREAFSDQLGEWCRSHGVEYIGHIIEDMNAHMRLSCSGGHYFRALDGQDMAGIDVVLHQIIPGMAHYKHSASAAGGFADPEFFDYMLARLAASLSHIQPRMRGRAMCEVFGAYGWAAGVPAMKRLMDHMLVRGIHYFVPHAFSPNFPDPDCPPHFNAGGKNPEFEGFARLMRYANQTAELMGENTEIVSAAILYAAEAEWSGRDYMLSQKPAKLLCDAQLNYDILPIDAVGNAYVRDGVLRVGEMRYHALIVPYAEYLPQSFTEKLAELEAAGMRLVFVDGRPEGCTCGRVIPLAQIADFVRACVRACGGEDIALDRPFALLRFRHTRRDGADAFLFVNESGTEDFDGVVTLPVRGNGIRIDLLQDDCRRICAEDGRVRLSLCRGQSAVLLFGDTGEIPQEDEFALAEKPLEAVWQMSLKPAVTERETEGVYSEPIAVERLYNVTGIHGDPDFCGTIRYETCFDAPRGTAALDLGLVGECAHVYLNGTDLGVRIAPPYRYGIKSVVKERGNRLTVEVSNNLVHDQPDYFSHYMQIPPSGLLGPVRLLCRSI